MQIVQVIACDNILGEGPLWVPQEKALYWVDIDGCLIQRFSSITNTYEAFQQPCKVSMLAMRAQGGFVAASENGLYFWQPSDNQLTFITHPEQGKKEARFNDGKVDSGGRLWAGTMTPQGASSALYRLDPDLTIRRMLKEVTISNGIGWSPDQRSMYHADSNRRTIFAYDYDDSSGEITNRRVFAELAQNEGVPDGLTVDSQGCLWCAIYDGWCLLRFDPDGKRMATIRMPVARPSSCIFGGEALNLLYVTSISEGLSAQQREQQPLAGDVFVFETDCSGIPEPKFLG